MKKEKLTITRKILSLWIIAVSFAVVGCSKQLSAEERVADCEKFIQFANKSVEEKMFTGTPLAFTEAADRLESTAKEIKATKFLDADLKKLAERQAKTNLTRASLARELAAVMEKLNKKSDDPELLRQLEELSDRITQSSTEISEDIARNTKCKFD